MHITMAGNRNVRVILAVILAAVAVVVQGQNTTVLPPIDTTMMDTVQPTVPPTVPPTSATPPPSTSPPVTVAPTTAAPVETAAPTEMPVTTVVPTGAPVETTVPTTAPVETVVPTEMPVATEVPTAMPVETTVPTAMPTELPTIAPTAVTVAPTVTPTSAPTEVPTKAPTAAPTRPGETPSPTQAGVPVEPAKFPNLSMTMSGVTTLSDSSWETFEKTYVAFNQAFYSANPQFGVSGVDILLDLVSQNPPANRRLGERQLQETLTVVYNQAITYAIIPGSSLEPADVVTQPFATQTSREAFANMLQRSGDAAFASINSVSSVTQAQAPASDGGGLSTGAIIGIAVGGTAGLALLAGGGYWLLTRDNDGGYAKDVGDQPPSSLNLGGGDDVSTLQDPTRDNRISTYGDQSVATVDYDYSKAYGGGGDTSVVSSVGGTLGSQTQATAPGAGVVDGSFSDDAFDTHYQDPNANVREVALEVWAPPGKLGVVIDTPNDGAPVVHAIKDSSPIADKLQVGDKLIAVDDQNVETMTAIKVSKLISRKSANSTRKLSIVRTVVDD